MNLYQIADWLNSLESDHTSDSGFLTDEGKGILEDSLFADFDKEDDKELAQSILDRTADDIGRWLCNLDRTLRGIEDEMRYLRKRKEVVQSTFESVKEYGRQSLFSLGIKKAGLVHPLTRVRTAGKVDVVDPSVLPDHFADFKVKFNLGDLTAEERVLVMGWMNKPDIFEVERTFRKKDIRDTMKTETVPGVDILPGETLRFRRATPKD
jgi:hypothetical protein